MSAAMVISNKDAGAEVCQQAFGAVLTQQGRGYYVTLELLAIAWGTYNLDGSVLPSCEAEQLRYLRRSHDFARRWMADDRVTDRDREFVRGVDGPEILRALLESLRVPIPNRRIMPGWLGQHLFPYVGELIHYDAAPRFRRENGVSIERYTYRGGGGLAHKILRCDPDVDRLEANRRGLRRLVEDSGGPLGQLARACSAHDLGKDSPDGFTDEKELKTIVDHTEWVNHLRAGVRNITSRNVVRAKQVELLMMWVPYCIARHALDRAAVLLGRDPIALPASMVQRNTPVRQAARRELDHARGFVDEALRVQAESQADDAGAEEAAVYERLLGSRTWRNPIVGFFTQTLATVGALNAHTGSRYMTLQLPILEAIVCASLASGEEMRFDEFCQEVLWGRYRIVADHRAAAGAGMTARIDAADLAENAEQLARDLSRLGLLTAYSDATRMVHGEVT